MSVMGYWVELYESEQRLGGGFLVMRRFVLTALHCLRGLTALDERVDIVLADGKRLAGQVRQRDQHADLALITILGPCGATVSIPRAGTARSGDAWHGPYRPALTEAHLRGEVDNGAMDYESESGARIQALQLTAYQSLGDYSGYSGGPVVRGAVDDPAPVIVGILLEQIPDRVAADRAAGVLVAAAIGWALRRFEDFEVEHLIDVLRPTDPLPGDSGQAKNRAMRAAMAPVEQLLEMIDEWAGRSGLDASQISELKLFAAKKAIERQLGDDAT